MQKTDMLEFWNIQKPFLIASQQSLTYLESDTYSEPSQDLKWNIFPKHFILDP